MLGYLAAGVVIGPVARFITDAGEIMQVAELGIVMFLFLIGLELKPARLWRCGADIFGLGLAQVVLTGTILAAIFYLAGWRIGLPSSSGSASPCRRRPSACRC